MNPSKWTKLTPINWTYIGGIVLLCLTLGTTACTSVMDYAFDPPTYPSTTPFKAKVSLYLPKDVQELEWETDSFGKKIIEIGKVFSSHAEAMTKNLFAEVIVVKNQPSLAEGVREAVLSPKVVTLEHARPLFIFQDQHTTMIVEWTLVDAQRHMVWKETVSARDSRRLSEGGFGDFADAARAQVTAVLREIFRKTYEAMSTSAEIKEFSSSQQH